MKRIAVLVSNDLVHDQRVRKSCDLFIDAGLEVLLVGRAFENSEPISRKYQTHRFTGMRWNRGALFYISFQWRLLKFLFQNRKRIDGIWANDLDTLLPAYLIAKLRKCALIYDSHEYFTEAAGLTGRPFPKKVWEWTEGFIFPRLHHVFTVNESIAEIYRNKYKVPVKVLRNMPLLTEAPKKLSRSSLNLPEGKLVILQGAFMDKDRGVLEAVRAMKYLPEIHFLLVGAGEEWEAAKHLRTSLSLERQVTILPKQPFELLRSITASADLGLSLDKAVHFNYFYSLPNKLFDYIHAGIPVLASPLPEVRKVVESHRIGEVLTDWEPKTIAAGIQKLLSMPKDTFKPALTNAAKTLNWQAQAHVVLDTLREAGLTAKDASEGIS